LAAWREAFAGYRKHITNVRLMGWLEQFAEGHRDLAARVLDAVEFFRPDQIDVAYRSVLRILPGWTRYKKDRKGRWRFVPFSIRPGESGDSMLHAFRVANGLTARQHNELFIYKADLMKESFGPDDTVVFVDDFTGTGDQAIRAWNETLAELLPGRPRTFLVLIAAVQDAARRIMNETLLTVRSHRRLGARDNFFSDDCISFTTEEKATVLEYCHIADAPNARGYGQSGLLVVMAHRCPNNSIPILHARNPAFSGLFLR
jgi:hypothetical protein